MGRLSYLAFGFLSTLLTSTRHHPLKWVQEYTFLCHAKLGRSQNILANQIYYGIHIPLRGYSAHFTKPFADI